jgi:hypothetical protein
MIIRYVFVEVLMRCLELTLVVVFVCVAAVAAEGLGSSYGRAISAYGCSRLS